MNKKTKRKKEKIEHEKIEKEKTDEKKSKIKKKPIGKTNKNSKNERNQNNLRTQDNNKIESTIYDSCMNKKELLFHVYNSKNNSSIYMKIIDFTPNEHNENFNVNVDDVIPCVHNFEINRVNYYEWKLINIPTKLYNIERGIGQEMFNVVIESRSIDKKYDI
ncbi:serine/threonine protein kinase, FIKK family, putative [Plasmodium sp. gorilla clade G3]|nr:serine/threonine protein kinase, FIKK family, putative [Plasmodium sp. gorilla clade G3]